MYKGLFNKKHFIKGILYLIIFIYLVFLFVDLVFRDLGNIYSIYLKYTEIILCFIMVLFIGSDGYSIKDIFLIQSARFFTLIADYFLMILNNYFWGIICFCIVQIIYIIRHTIVKKDKLKNIVFLLSAFIACFAILLNINRSIEDASLYISAAIYACFLITSVFCAVSTIYKSSYPKTGAYVIAIGMLLFFLCDLNVGIYNLTLGMRISFFHIRDFNFFSGFLMWFFYLPSQLLLSLSGFKLNYLKKVFLR